MTPEQRRFWVAVRRCLLSLADLIKTGPLTWPSEEGEDGTETNESNANCQ